MDDDIHVDRMEGIPAYLRKKQGNATVVSEPVEQNEVSRFSISKEEGGLKDKNGFLHDNVD